MTFGPGLLLLLLGGAIKYFAPDKWHGHDTGSFSWFVMGLGVCALLLALWWHTRVTSRANAPTERIEVRDRRYDDPMI